MADDEARASSEEIAGEEVRSGLAWVGRTLKPVEYTVVDGQAVVEGCIILGSVEEIEKLTADAEAYDGSVEEFGSVIVGPQYRWTKGIVAYTIEPGLPRPERVTQAIDHWRTNTSLRFVERTAQNESYYPNWITFRRVASGCGSLVGCRREQQFINLADNCERGNIIHEIGHAVGLWHEQSRNDREEWVEIDLSTVPNNKRNNFTQTFNAGQDTGGYDYSSIMHYSATAFSTNGSVTIRPKKSGAERMGQREGLSAGDIATVAAIYA